MKPSDYIRKGWCQHSAARDAYGHSVDACDPQASEWCLSGAIVAAYPEEVVVREKIYPRLKKKLDVTSISNIINWNDAVPRTQLQVIELLESIGE